MSNHLELGKKIHEAVRALITLVQAEIAEKTRDDPDSMGTYHEEHAFEEAMKDLVEEVRKPHSPADNYFNS
jgi:hypothetical protein